jgi:hypothetical protein
VGAKYHSTNHFRGVEKKAMKKTNREICATRLYVSACLIAMSFAANAQLDFKGKMKEGQYETSVSVDMPGAPKGVGQPAKSKYCITRDDIEKGKGDVFGGQNKSSQRSSCEIKNIKQTGSTAAYDMICPVEGIESNVQLTFSGDAIKGTTTTKMTGENAKKMPAQFRVSKSSFETKYLGACQK